MSAKLNEKTVDRRLCCNTIAATDTSHEEVAEPHYVRMSFSKEQIIVLVETLQRELDVDGANLIEADIVARRLPEPNEFGHCGIEITFGIDKGSLPAWPRSRDQHEQ